MKLPPVSGLVIAGVFASLLAGIPFISGENPTPELSLGTAGWNSATTSAGHRILPRSTSSSSSSSSRRVLLPRRDLVKRVSHVSRVGKQRRVSFLGTRRHGTSGGLTDAIIRPSDNRLFRSRRVSSGSSRQPAPTTRHTHPRPQQRTLERPWSDDTSKLHERCRRLVRSFIYRADDASCPPISLDVGFCQGDCRSYTEPKQVLAGSGHGSRPYFTMACRCCKPSRFEVLSLDLPCPDNPGLARTVKVVSATQCACSRCASRRTIVAL